MCPERKVGHNRRVPRGESEVARYRQVRQPLWCLGYGWPTASAWTGSGIQAVYLSKVLIVPLVSWGWKYIIDLVWII
jgi:hypothetical protein